MELLRFDSTSPAEQYAGLMRECRDALLGLPVVSQEKTATHIAGLQHLPETLTGFTDRPLL
jgi:hypothetical protein